MSVAYDVQAALANSLRKPKPGSGRELMTIEMSAGVANLLDQLAEKFDGGAGAALVQAIALLSIAVTAQQDGFHLAVIDKEDEVQTSFELPLQGR